MVSSSMEIDLSIGDVFQLLGDLADGSHCPLLRFTHSFTSMVYGI